WTDQPLCRKDIFARWSPDVRAHQYAFELLSRLHFVADKEGDEEAALISLTVKPDGTVDISRPFAILTRPPFDIKPELFEAELKEVLRKAGERSERMPEILTQFKVPNSFFAMLLNLQPGRHTYTYEVMSTAFKLASTVVMQFKNHLRVRRPADRSP